LVSFRGFSEDYIFSMVKYLSFHNSSFALRYFLMYMARPQCDTSLVCPGSFPDALDSQSRVWSCLFFFFYFPQFCDVAEVMIIHKTTPSFATVQLQSLAF
jgi:hypothetical protein